MECQQHLPGALRWRFSVLCCAVLCCAVCVFFRRPALLTRRARHTTRHRSSSSLRRTMSTSSTTSPLVSTASPSLRPCSPVAALFVAPIDIGSTNLQQIVVEALQTVTQTISLVQRIDASKGPSPFMVYDYGTQGILSDPNNPAQAHAWHHPQLHCSLVLGWHAAMHRHCDHILCAAAARHSVRRHLPDPRQSCSKRALSRWCSVSRPLAVSVPMASGNQTRSI